MFEKLVVSTSQRRKGRTAKFFVCTSFIYLSVAGVALALSVLLADAKLADTGNRSDVRIALPMPLGSQRPNVAPPNRDHDSTPRPDPGNVMKYEDLGAHQQSGPPQFKLPTGVQVGATEGVFNGDPDAGGTISSLVPMGGDRRAADPPPIPPDPPRPQPRAVEKARPLSLSSTVLQGKAVNRIVPVYPELPKRIRLQGEVSLEVIISPEGRVESVRVVSGHHMLVSSATDAARQWRFEPTFLNGVAVRVTGVITFVFKLNE